ncbi:hypothetical protein A2191_05030 [Candidatus Woesebacteria bacterium RIFOXYA1_FULL_38_9]|nr:MAG: hypothetical protein A2191_05030 [Candidatus Woesebacteria bacterium RIFOXYA1_FULL_38_9]
MSLERESSYQQSFPENITTNLTEEISEQEPIILRGICKKGYASYRGNHRSHLRGKGREALHRDMAWMPRYKK